MAEGETSLIYICQHLSETDPDCWEIMRALLNNPANTRDESTRSALSEQIENESCYVDDQYTTPLHVICGKNPPPDVVRILTDMAPNAMRMKDTQGNLPLHAACAYNAHRDVLECLIQKYPKSTITPDSIGRTPLHLAIQKQREELTPDAAMLLSSKYNDISPGDMVDITGKFPLHYACAWGVSKETLTVLINNNPACITKIDKQGFIPFHLALTNCQPLAVEHLISLQPSIASIHCKDDTKRHPLRLLADSAATFPTLLPHNPTHNNSPRTTNTRRDNAISCIKHYLTAPPDATAAFVTALQSLPPWLRDVAVVGEYVQWVINSKISQGCHAAFLFFDFMHRLATVIAFSWGVRGVIASFTFDEEGNYVPGGNSGPVWCVGVLYACGVYFLFREFSQVISLISLNLFKTWIADFGNSLDIICIGLCFAWGKLLSNEEVPYDLMFRDSVCVSYFIFWIWIIYFLKSFMMGFAVFIGGVLFVLKRLATFMTALFIILIASAMIFTTIFQNTPKCPEGLVISTDTSYQLKTTNYTSPASIEEENPFCTFTSSLLTCYTMMLGEVDVTLFEGYTAATIFFSIFMFLVVILLANVLIAIVTASYSVIKNERSAIVFWSNRLDFVAEIDCIIEPLKKKLFSKNLDINDKTRRLWDELIENFSHQNILIRIGTLLLISLIWMPLAIITAGFLCPPQVREHLLNGRYTQIKFVRKQGMEVEAFREEVKDLKEEINAMFSTDSDGVAELKSRAKELKRDVSTEIEGIKNEMIELFDLILSDTQYS